MDISEWVYKKNDNNISDFVSSSEPEPKLKKQIKRGVSNLYKTLTKEEKDKLNIILDIDLNKIKKNIMTINNHKYPEWIEQHKLWSLYGQFLDYLIRRITAKHKKIKLEDRKTIKCILDEQCCADEEIIILYLNISEEELYNNNKLNDEEFRNLNSFKNFKSDMNNEKYTKYFNSEDEALKIINYCNDFELELSEKSIKLLKSYKRYINTEIEHTEVIKDIFNCAIAHSLFFGSDEYLKYYNTNNQIINIEHIKEIEFYINNTLNEKNNILLNPAFGFRCNSIHITGDADLIIDDIILDIKTSKNIKHNISDIIQQYIYISLYKYHNNSKINKIILYNPLLNIEYLLDVSNWTKEDKLIDFIKKLT